MSPLALWETARGPRRKQTNKQTDEVRILAQDQQIQNNHTLHVKMHNCRIKVSVVKELKPRRELLVPGSIRLPLFWACVLCAAAFVSQKRVRWDERLPLAWNLHTNAATAPKSRHGVKTTILKSRMFFKVVPSFSTEVCFVSLNKKPMIRIWSVFMFSTLKLVSTANLTTSLKRSCYVTEKKEDNSPTAIHHRRGSRWW